MKCMYAWVESIQVDFLAFMFMFVQIIEIVQEVRNVTIFLILRYYFLQILPPLDRIFSLLGVDVFSWYNDLPRVTRVIPLSHYAAESKKVSNVLYLVTEQTFSVNFWKLHWFLTCRIVRYPRRILTLKTSFVLFS